MAFGDALRPTDGATVVLHVDTSETAKLERAEAQWRESVGTMSREALKLDLAQDRLKKSLSAYGAESVQAKRATIALKDAEEAASRSADRLTRETQQLTSAQNRLHSSQRGLLKTAVGLAGAYVGVHGLVYAAKSALNASSNLAEQQDFANRIFKAGTPIIQNYANNALGLARDQAFEAASGIGALLSKFTESDTEAANLSVRLTKLGVDLASIKNTGVDEALTALRAGLVGETEPLRRYAVLLNAASVQQEALRMTGKESAEQLTEGEKVLARVNIITREAAYAQGNYADTIDSTANKEREAQKNFRNTAILIGDTLQPAYRELLGRVNDYLGSAENQRAIQEKVNRLVETSEEVVRGFAGAMRTLHSAVKPVVTILGGTENAIKLLLIAMAVGKVLSFARAIRLVGTNARFAAGGLAMMGTASAGARGIGGVGVAGAAAGLAGVALTGGIGDVSSHGGAAAPIIYAQEMYRVNKDAAIKFARGRGIPLALLPLGPAEAAEYVRTGKVPGAGGIPYPDREDRAAAAKAGARSGSTGRGGSRGGGDSRPTLEDLLLDVARPGNDRRDLQALRAYYARQIRILEAKKNLTKAQKEALRALYGEIASVQSQIDALEQEQADKEAAATQKANEKKEAAARKQERAMDAAMKAAERRHKLLAGTGGSVENMRRQALRGVKGTVDAIKKQQQKAEAEKMLTEAEVRRMHFDFLTGLQGLNNQFGSNFSTNTSSPTGTSQSETRLWELTELQRENNRAVYRLASAAHHPGAKYARNEMSAVLGGVGAI